MKAPVRPCRQADSSPARHLPDTRSARPGRCRLHYSRPPLIIGNVAMSRIILIEQVFKNRLTTPQRARKRAARLARKQSALRRSVRLERLEDRLAPSLNPALFELDKNAINATAVPGDDWNNVLCPSAGCPSPTPMPPVPGPGGGSLANTGVIVDPAGTTIFTTGG